MRACPHCSKQIKDDAELCKFCLQPVPKAGEAQQGTDDAVSRARAALAAGSKLFQIALPLSQTAATVVAMSHASVHTRTTEHASMLDAIEAEGWRLEHANYVYRVTGSVSRDKFLSSGQQEAVSGEIIGVYLFRRVPSS